MSKQLIRLLSWNMRGCFETINGLKTNKLDVDEITKHFSDYDIIFFQETHLDREKAQNLQIPSFAPGIHYIRPKRHKAVSSSGGITHSSKKIYAIMLNYYHKVIMT